MLIGARREELLVLHRVIQKKSCPLQELANELHIPERTIEELVRKVNFPLK